MRQPRALLWFAIAAIAGLVSAEILYRWPASRALLARAFGIEREMSPLTQNLRAAARAELPNEQLVQRDLQLLRDQFADEKLFASELRAAGSSLGALRAQVAEHESELAWIEKQIAPQPPVAEAEERAFYEAHRAQFLLPPRFHAAHIFLAAPEDSPPETVLAKQNLIQGIAVRLLAGDAFPQLAAEASEDERTKSQNGDLGWFAAARMPPEFIAEVQKLKAGETSAPFKSHLGFHIVQLIAIEPAREMTFAEAQPEIQLSLGNTHRQLAVAQLQDRLAGKK